jgi:mRNA interferase RelE/StbE
LSWKVLWLDRALKETERLDRPTRERIFDAVERLATTGQGDVRPLLGRSGEYRLRVGNWRILFQRDGAQLVILVLRVRPRGDAYKLDR